MTAIFGIAERDGRWLAVVQTHEPCSGGAHRGCTVVDTYESDGFATSEEAVEECRAIATRVAGRNLRSVVS